MEVVMADKKKKGLLDQAIDALTDRDEKAAALEAEKKLMDAAEGEDGEQTVHEPRSAQAAHTLKPPIRSRSLTVGSLTVGRPPR